MACSWSKLPPRAYTLKDISAKDATGTTVLQREGSDAGWREPAEFVVMPRSRDSRLWPAVDAVDISDDLVRKASYPMGVQMKAFRSQNALVFGLLSVVELLSQSINRL